MPTGVFLINMQSKRDEQIRRIELSRMLKNLMEKAAKYHGRVEQYLVKWKSVFPRVHSVNTDVSKIS